MTAQPIGSPHVGPLAAGQMGSSICNRANLLAGVRAALFALVLLTALAFTVLL